MKKSKLHVEKHPRTLDETRQLALVILQKRGAMSAANLGSELWGNRFRKPQSYCLPAGRVLHGLLRDGLAHKEYTDTHILWAVSGRQKTT